jgi:hypothetical protein
MRVESLFFFWFEVRRAAESPTAGAFGNFSTITAQEFSGAGMVASSAGNKSTNFS